MGSIHNELTGRSGFISRAIHNALQIENAEVGVERLSETLTPVVDLWQRPEWSLLRGERIWGVAPTSTALAGNFSQVGIFNPAGSGLIVVVKEIWPQINGIVQVGLAANVAFTATSTPNSRDSRTALLTGVSCGSFAHQSAAVIFAATVMQLNIAGGSYARYPVEIVLSPGFCVALATTGVNTAVTAAFLGYERPAFAGELTARA